MILNFGSVSGNVIEMGYTGAYTGSTYPFTAPYNLVDGNSLFFNQVYDDGSSFRIVSGPSNGTLDTATAQTNSLWGNDINDFYTPNEGFVGDDLVTLEVLYPDNSTAQWVATITTEAGADTSPTAFTVAPLTDQPLNQLVEFGPVTVAGVDAGVDVTVSVTGTGVEYAVDTGTGYGGFTSASTTVQLGYLVKARILTPQTGTTEVTGTLTIGDKSSNLSATTIAVESAGLTGVLVADANDTALPVVIAVDVRVTTGDATRTLIGTGTITTDGVFDISNDSITLETGQSMTFSTSYYVEFKEQAGDGRQKTVLITTQTDPAV
jgi:hypothetical protein